MEITRTAFCETLQLLDWSPTPKHHTKYINLKWCGLVAKWATLSIHIETNDSVLSGSCTAIRIILLPCSFYDAHVLCYELYILMCLEQDADRLYQGSGNWSKLLFTFQQAKLVAPNIMNMWTPPAKNRVEQVCVIADHLDTPLHTCTISQGVRLEH